MATSDNRKEWKLCKKIMEDCKIDFRSMASKTGFGPALDDFQDKLDASEKASGDKKEKLETEVKKLGTKAQLAGGAYLKLLDVMVKGMKKTGTPNPEDKVKLAAFDTCREKVNKIITNVRAGMSGI